MGLESRALRGVHAHAGFRRGGPAVVQRARRRRDAAPPVRAARCGDILARDPLADRQRGRVGRVPRAQVPRLAVPRGDAVLAAPPRRRRRVREVGRAPRAPAGGSGRGPSGKKGAWRARIKWGARFAVAFALLYYFGRTTYQLTFFAKAGLNRYVYHPLARHRPIPCGVDTPPTDPFLAPLARRAASPKDVDDASALGSRGRALAGSRAPARGDGLREVTGGEDAERRGADARRRRGRRAGPGDGDARNAGPGATRTRAGPRRRLRSPASRASTRPHSTRPCVRV